LTVFVRSVFDNSAISPKHSPAFSVATRTERPSAQVSTSTSPAKVQGGAKQLEGKRVIVVEDGPTTTHGGMGFGAGYVAVEEIHGVEIVDPRPHAVGSIRALFERYPHLKNVVPAMGYTKEQVKELEDTINQSGADIVVAGTPIDLKRVIKVKMPVVRVRYDCPPELVERLRPLVARPIVEVLERAGHRARDRGAGQRRPDFRGGQRRHDHRPARSA